MSALEVWTLVVDLGGATVRLDRGRTVRKTMGGPTLLPVSTSRRERGKRRLFYSALASGDEVLAAWRIAPCKDRYFRSRSCASGGRRILRVGKQRPKALIGLPFSFVPQLINHYAL